MPLHGFAFEAVPHAPHLADLPLLEALHRALPEQAIDEVVAATGAQERRRRRLPARLVVAGTHVLCDAVLRPCFRGEAPAARQLLRSVGPGMLVMWDRGLHSYAMLRDTRARDAHFLGRVGKAVVLTPEETLPDGSFLA